MPVSPTYRPDPQYQQLGAEFADPAQPADFPKADIRFRNDRIAARVGLDTLTDQEWRRHFARFEPLPGNQQQPLAMRYHGHQFRSYNPDLGDGRGFLFAQLREAETNRLLDLGTKGSGQTRWSRAGDGRLTLKGGVREVLATEMLEALGVPTSKTFSLIETGEQLTRGDEPSPTRSAVMVRLSHGHIRYGSFQRHAFHQRPDLLERLLDYVVEQYFPELLAIEGAAARAPALLAAVGARAARTTAAWMAAGFVHGVLNTDNMNLTGESFDYGPWRFLPRNDPNFTAAYFDQTGLYAFGRQPEAVFWNLQQLGSCFTLLAEKEAVVDALNTFPPAYQDALRLAMLARLGLQPRAEDDDVALVNSAFRALASGGEALRWEPFFFDWFGGDDGRALRGPRAELYVSEPCSDFRQRLAPYAAGAPSDPYFDRPEPEEMLIDEVEAIWAPIAADDDWKPFRAKLARVSEARRAYGIAVP